MKKNVLKLAMIAAFALQASAASAASIAYIGSCSTGNYLSQFGHTVTHVSENASLAGYDAALVSSNCQFSNPNGLGTTLKNFVDAGHNVVIAQFSLQGNWQVGGGINQQGYNPFINDPSSGNYFGSFTFGNNYAPSSSLFSGVNTANLGNQFAGNVGLSAGATLVADWVGGRHAIAYNKVGSAAVVGLNLFPSDGNVNPDTQRLVSNALTFEAPSSDVPEPASLALIGLGIAGVAFARRRKSV